MLGGGTTARLGIRVGPPRTDDPLNCTQVSFTGNAYSNESSVGAINMKLNGQPATLKFENLSSALPAKSVLGGPTRIPSLAVVPPPSNTPAIHIQPSSSKSLETAMPDSPALGSSTDSVPTGSVNAPQQSPTVGDLPLDIAILIIVLVLMLITVVALVIYRYGISFFGINLGFSSFDARLKTPKENLFNSDIRSFKSTLPKTSSPTNTVDIGNLWWPYSSTIAPTPMSPPSSARQTPAMLAMNRAQMHAMQNAKHIYDGVSRSDRDTVTER